MTEHRFQGLSNDELADIWYALGGAEKRHPEGFTRLRDEAFTELSRRLGGGMAPYLDERFRQYREEDAKSDGAAHATPATGARTVRDTYPA
jgi:hypothetical protein